MTKRYEEMPDVEAILNLLHEPYKQNGIDFLDRGDLSPAFEEHLNECSHCQEAVDKLLDWMAMQLDR